MLTFSTLKSDLYRLAGVTSSSVRDDIEEAARLAILKGQERFVRFGDWSFLNQYQNVVYIPLAAPYETGTVTVTQDSKTVTGSGTAFTADMAGDFFQLDGGEIYEIRTFTSATSIELAIPYQSDTAADEDFKILKRFYPIPLDFVRPVASQAVLSTPGSMQELALDYNPNASFADLIQTGTPQWWGVIGNTRNADYYNTGTVTITTSGGVSTWTVSSGTLPTDSVDRYVRISGEDRFYRVKTRTNGTVFITYETYVNPSDQTSTQATASVWAMTPLSTQLISFSQIPNQRYIFKMPYIKRLPELLLDTDISPISYAGYDNAFLSCCRAEMVKDGRVAIRGDLIGPTVQNAEMALAEAWNDEVYAQSVKEQSAGGRFSRDQVGPSWL